MKAWIALLILILTTFLTSCKNGDSTTRSLPKFAYPDTSYASLIAGNFIDSSSLTIDSVQIPLFFNRYPELKSFEKEVFSFYKTRTFELAWHDSLGRIETFQLLVNRALQMEEDGLAEEVPYLNDFKRFASKSLKDSIQFVDLMQTAQYFHFAHHVLGGLPEQEIKLLDWFIPKSRKNYAELLNEFIQGDELAFDKAVFSQYHLLKKSLIELKEIQAQGGWPLVTGISHSLQYGTNDSLVNKIKKRLSVSADWQNSDTSNLFTAELVDAVKSFQTRHGLLADGIIGKQTITAMNIPIENQIKQIIINMERCRWLPVLPEGDYLLVNIPSFSLRLMHRDSLVLECEAIVGKETNKTAVFKGMLEYIVFNPYWNIPDKILEKEILPILSRNRNYLKDNHMEWYKGRLRQRPGPDNALGQIKFLLPNPFDIYLHDTPSKGLFKEQKRAFSHGCIRISAPKQLASYLLREQKGWHSNKTEAILATNEEYYVKLDKVIPVYILYLTAFVDDQGKLNFREDLYQRDPSLEKMMMKN